jgi:hypothetical protein
MDQNSSGFLYLKLKSLRINEAKFKEGKFVDPQIREILGGSILEVELKEQLGENLK